MKKVNVAVIGGTGTDAMLNAAGQMRIGTPFGLAPPIFLGEVTKETMHILQEVLKEAVLNLPEKRQCPCANASREAKFQG